MTERELKTALPPFCSFSQRECMRAGGWRQAYLVDMVVVGKDSPPVR